MTVNPFPRGSMHRRSVVTAGVLGLSGFQLADLLRAEAAAPGATRGMSCILVWLRGGPSSIDMWDLKPDAPAEIRGEFRPIRTVVPGIEISDQLPLCARQMDKLCLVRSVTHPRDDHEGGAHVNSTGWNTWGAQPYPIYGTIVQKMLGHGAALPPHVHLPEVPPPWSGGEHYLSQKDLPFSLHTYNDPDLRFRDMAPEPALPDSRLTRRRHLARAVGTRLADAGDAVRTSDAHYQRAFDLLTGPAARAAFDLTREPAPVRARYGFPLLGKDPVANTAGNQGFTPNEFNRSILGQGLLMARRLVEAGVRFVTVVGRGWDTHDDNFGRLKDTLLPPLDRGLSALMQDLHDRGLLATTLVVVTGDFNRTPKINPQAGRDHWGRVQTIVMAGAGIPGGTVLGASDAECAYPAERPLRPDEVAATIYHRFGVRPDSELIGIDGRPFRVLPEGAAPIRELM